MNSAVWTSNNPIFMIFRHAFRRDISHLPRLRSRFCLIPYVLFESQKIALIFSSSVTLQAAKSKSFSLIST